jgi:hypothetical protein
MTHGREKSGARFTALPWYFGMKAHTHGDGSEGPGSQLDAGTCIDPKMQIVDGKTVCVVTCQRSPEPVLIKWKGIEATPEGDFFVRSGPGTVKLPPESAREYIRTRFAQPS